MDASPALSARAAAAAGPSPRRGLQRRRSHDEPPAPGLAAVLEDALGLGAGLEGGGGAVGGDLTALERQVAEEDAAAARSAR